MDVKMPVTPKTSGNSRICILFNSLQFRQGERKKWLMTFFPASLNFQSFALTFYCLYLLSWPTGHIQRHHTSTFTCWSNTQVVVLLRYFFLLYNIKQILFYINLSTFLQSCLTSMFFNSIKLNKLMKMLPSSQL